jgi:hypothetical protein
MQKSQTVTKYNTIVQKGGNSISNMDGDTIMLSINNGKYYNLGKVGGEIWERINEPITIAELVTFLISEYDVERSVCEEEVIGFLDMLLKEDLIEI